MKRLAAVALFASALAACSGTDVADLADVPDQADTVTGSPEEELPLLEATALEELVTKDHTFGEGPAPFTEYLIQSHVDPHAGAPDGDTSGRARWLTAAERAAIEDAVRPLGPVRWIDDPDRWRTEDLVPTIEGAAILGVGEPNVDGDSALVPVSLWCGGLCGTWLTYRLDKIDATWRVTGTEGPIAIS